MKKALKHLLKLLLMIEYLDWYSLWTALGIDQYIDSVHFCRFRSYWCIDPAILLPQAKTPGHGLTSRTMDKTVHCTALNFTALHCTALHCTALHCSALYCFTLHYTALYSITPHCTALYCTTLHCTAQHCTALHCSPLFCNATERTALHCTALHLHKLYCR